MSRIQRLYQLQSLDSEIDKTNHHLAELAAKMGESEALQQAKTTLGDTDKTLRQAQTQVQDLTLEVKSLSDKIAAEEKKLYHGKAMSAKEATNLQGEIASLKRRHSQREESLLEAMLAAEAAETAAAQAHQNLAAVQSAWQVEQEQVRLAHAGLTTTLAQLKAQRPTMLKAIDGDDLEEYEDLRRRKSGRAVALVKEGICQGCGMGASSSKVQLARAGTDLIYCGGCGRILYAP
ncbi:MAG: hypothetical protein U0401_06965 [Anaerolineae bacterium]